VATEEAQNENWCFGRFACVGDSIAKSPPNAGLGGNGAIESAAALTNCTSPFSLASPLLIASIIGLYKMLHSKDPVDFSSTEKALKDYHAIRKDRSRAFVKAANDLPRHEVFSEWYQPLLTAYLFP